MSADPHNSSWQRYFTPGMKLVGIGAAAYLAYNNFGNLKSADFDLVPMNSVLHGIQHSSLPFNHIKVDGKSYDIKAFIEKQFDEPDATTFTTDKIQLLTGQVFTSGDVATKPHLDKYYTVASGDPWEMTKFDETKNNAYIHYAMGCVDWTASIKTVTATGGTSYTSGGQATEDCMGIPGCMGSGFTGTCQATRPSLRRTRPSS